MAQKLSVDPSGAGMSGDSSTVTESALDDATLVAGQAISVYSRQVPADKAYFWGFGTTNRDDARSAFMHADLVDASGNAIEGDLEVEITDSERRDTVRRYNYGDLGNLADAASDDRTDRPMQPALAPGAREDRHIEIKVVADSASDGVTVDPDASDVRLWYTEVDA